MDNGLAKRSLIFVALLALLAGGISPLFLARQAGAATTLDWTSAQGPGSGDAPAMVMGGSVLYRGTSGRGVWKYQSGTWTSLGGTLSMTGITTLAFDTGGNKLYAGTNGAGVWEYDPTDGSWSDIAVIPGDFHSYFITAMAWGEDGNNKLYVGCWDSSLPPSGQGTGVWCYDPSDGGTWTDTAGSVTTWRIISLQWGGGVLYAGCIDRAGGGETPKGVWYYSPANPGPDKWTDTDDFFVSGSAMYSLAWDSTNSLLYAGYPNGSGLFRYDRVATTWTDLRKFGVYGTTSLAYDPVHRLVYIGQADPASTDYEGVWYYDPVSDTYNPTNGAVSTYNVTSLVFASGQYLFGGTAGQGVWRYNGSSWSDTRGGVSTYGISALAWDDTHHLLYSATAGYGVWCYDPATGDWTDTGGGEATYYAYTVCWGGGKLYAGCRNYFGNPIGVWSYDPATQSWSDTAGSVTGYLVGALAWDSSRNLLYAGTGDSDLPGTSHGVWSYDLASPATDKWTNIGAGDVDTFFVRYLTMGGDTLYASCKDPSAGAVGVWKYDLTNPGAGWSNAGGSVSNFDVYSMAWSGSRLYANCRGAFPELKGLYYYDPASPAVNKWTKASDPIITLRMFTIAWAYDRLFVSCTAEGVGVAEGVWCYDPSGDEWSDTDGAVSGLHVTDLAVDGSSRLYAGTGAQGVYYAGVHAPPTLTSISPGSGAAGTTVTITDLKGTGFYGTPTVKLKKSGQADIAAASVSVVSSTKITCRFNLAGAALGAWNLFIQNPDGKSATRNNAFTVVPPPSGTSTWYLAEGTTAWGFSTYISIANPNASTLATDVTYMPTGRAAKTETVTLPANSQTTLTNDHLVNVLGGQADFSTRVECADRTKPIAVDRTMTWTGTGAPSPEAHCSVGVTSPAKTWYLPEGSSAWGFESWLLIQNPNAAPATAKVTYMIEGESALTVSHTVPGNSRASFNMASDVGAKDASIKVESDVPVIPERAMYKNERREGHDSIGTTSPASDCYLAEGTTAWGFTTYVLVQNSNTEACDVTVTYMTPSGAVPQAEFSMSGRSRKTIRVNDVAGMGNTDFSTRVHGSRPIIAERAMYWGAGTVLGEACHDSIGMAAPHTTFYLPDGQADAETETWTLVQNPNGSAVTVDVTYLTPSGTGDVTRTETIGANSRKTFGMNEHSHLTGRASIAVKSKTAGKKIMVERAMYWYNKGAGTDTIGGYSD